MKKIGFMIIPILVVIAAGLMLPKVMSGAVSMSTLAPVYLGVILFMFLLRPKKGPSKSAQQVLSEVYDDYCKDAFAEHPELEKKFIAAVNDFGKSLPKSALNKLQSLSEECATKQQKYAVAMAAALICRATQDYKHAIREYNKAIVLNPTDTLAYNIGDCQQRLGNLDKAIDSYEFAMELNPESARYPSSIATACVGSGKYDRAIGYAEDALAIDPEYAQALATMAICYGLKDDPVMHKHYSVKAAEAGYKLEKIDATIKALKKR